MTWLQLGGWAFTSGIIARNADLGMVGNEGRENGKGSKIRNAI